MGSVANGGCCSCALLSPQYGQCKEEWLPEASAGPGDPAYNPVIRPLSVISVMGLNLYRLFDVSVLH